MTFYKKSGHLMYDEIANHFLEDSFVYTCRICTFPIAKMDKGKIKQDIEKAVLVKMKNLV